MSVARAHSVRLILRAIGAMSVAVLLSARALAAPAPNPDDLPCPNQPSSSKSIVDYHGQKLVGTYNNFSGLDLTNANFEGATLQGIAFVRTTLTGANFRNATFIAGDIPAVASDFTFANLDSACFINAKFQGPAYFTQANVDKADFSFVDLTLPPGGGAIFGDAPLHFDNNAAAGDRLKFRYATLSCEFVPQWPLLDLTGAHIGACASRLATPQTTPNAPGFDFSNAMLAGVDFSSAVTGTPLDLSRSKWQGAVLEGVNFGGVTLDGATGFAGSQHLAGATFSDASAQGVDFSGSLLYGAKFSRANLTNTSFASAYLIAQGADYPAAAKFDDAHLKNATFANAQLDSVVFDGAAIYGSFGGFSPSIPCKAGNDSACTIPSGPTCSCANMSGASLVNASFSAAFLYGVDFTERGTKLYGTSFDGAVLVGSSFKNASFGVNSLNAAPVFTNAYLQGVDLTVSQAVPEATLTGAFVDFGNATNTENGNELYLQLLGRFTKFPGWTGKTRTPCVQLVYSTFTIPPSISTGLTCPNGEPPAAGCGTGTKAPRRNKYWNGGTAISDGPNRGWYDKDATYDNAPADPSVICGNGGIADPNW